MARSTDKEFSLEYQYEMYLRNTGLDKAKMHPTQAQETKRAFFGACGQMLALGRDNVAEIEDEDEAIGVMRDMLNQTVKFWANEVSESK